jgi:hypothetical protein
MLYFYSQMANGISPSCGEISNLAHMACWDPLQKHTFLFGATTSNMSATGPSENGFYNLFFGVFVVLVIACAILRLMSRTAGENLQKSDAFKKFQLNFLIIYFIVMGTPILHPQKLH